MVRRHIAAIVEPYDITPQQYNVLRILRGSHPKPMPTLEIADRLIEQMPGITRLLDRLEAKQLVYRVRGAEDRRMVHCSITTKGRELLSRLDDHAERADAYPTSALSAEEAASLVTLLAKVRGAGQGE